MDIIPSFLSQDSFYDGDAFGNIRLRMGEVQEIIPHTDHRSYSKKYNEYTVLVQHRSNGTVVGRMYSHCLVSTLFGGGADRMVYTLRADRSGKEKSGLFGMGSKVLLLCVNGDTHNAVIIGGIRDSKDTKDDPIKGHHLHFTFNGVSILIDKDGQLLMEVGGATDHLGKPAKGAQVDKLPTTVRIEKNGTFRVATKDGASSIVIDQAGAVTVTASGKCTVVAEQVELGASGIAGLPPQGVVLGSWIEPLTGKPVAILGGTSNVVFAAK